MGSILLKSSEGINHMQLQMINDISKIFQCSPDDIKDIKPLKKGMTNNSFTFIMDGEKYILRMPGEGTNKLIDRQKEYEIYQEIAHLNLADDIIYINPITGYKITRFWENARVCNPFSPDDVAICMKKLKEFHNMNITVNHIFCPFERIEFYESLWSGPSCYEDYKQTKAKVMALKDYISTFSPTYSLTHIDAVPDNFLFIGSDNEVRLIDWEYAAMQDKHMDIAMFIVYAMYDSVHALKTIELYFQGSYNNMIGKIHAYIAVCGLLWSNWCEYKRQKGVEFGEYALRQYQYAKDYA